MDTSEAENVNASLLAAMEAAMNKAAEYPPEYGLALATPSPLRLPDGWRFPYNSFFGPYRVRRCMVILFVDTTTPEPYRATEEWNNFAQQENNDIINKLQQALRPSGDIGIALKNLRTRHPDAQIESVEPVWDLAQQPPLCWRIGIIKVDVEEGLRHYAVLAGMADGHLIGEPELLSIGAVGWRLGVVARQSGSLIVNLDKLTLVQQHHWTMLSCITCANQFVEGLNYSGIGPHNVRVEYVDMTGRPNTATVRGVPTLTFPYGGGWAQDPSVVLHELGHAWWSLLFTRTPASIKADKYGTELDGIREGFADYFAATQLANGGKQVTIGQGLVDRVLDGKRLDLPDPPGTYDICRKWANLLWDFRLRVERANLVSWDKRRGRVAADDVVLGAHIKPRLDGNAPESPLACYFQSLRQAARHLGVLLSDDDWTQLEQIHLRPAERPG